MEQVRNGRLDNYCESIATERATMNAARTEEQSTIQAAMQEMKAKGVHAYRHGGVELALVEGVDKLRVRLTKDADGAAGGHGLPSDAGDAQGDEQGDEGGDLDAGDGEGMVN